MTRNEFLASLGLLTISPFLPKEKEPHVLAGTPIYKTTIDRLTVSDPACMFADCHINKLYTPGNMSITGSIVKISKS